MSGCDDSSSMSRIFVNAHKYDDVWKTNLVFLEFPKISEGSEIVQSRESIAMRSEGRVSRFFTLEERFTK